MAIYYLNAVENFRADTEAEAQEFIERLKRDKGEVLKHSIEYKEQKAKGEVIQDWYRVTIKRRYNDEKEPTSFFTLDEEDVVREVE